MDILARLKPTRCDDTNANSTLTERRGCREVKNVVFQSVDTAYKLLRATKPVLPIICGKAQKIDILVNSRL